MTALVVLPSRGDLRRRRGGEVGPDDVGEVDEEPEDLYVVAPPVGGLTASDEEEGECWCGAGIGKPWVCC